MRVRFLKAIKVKAAPPDDVTFEQGAEVDLPEASAHHWINRGAAVPATGPAEGRPAAPRATPSPKREA